METSCGVILVNYGTVLLLQYPQGHWDFPKGHVEDSDEDHHSTAKGNSRRRPVLMRFLSYMDFQKEVSIRIA